MFRRLAEKSEATDLIRGATLLRNLCAKMAT